MPRQTRYRGRRRLARLLAGIGITVLVVSALLGTAYLFLRNYVSVTEDGILLSLPFGEGNSRSVSSYTPSPSASPSPTPDDEIQIVIESTPTPTPTPAPSPTPEPPLRAVFLPQSELKSTAKLENIAALCENGQIDAVVIEVKSQKGVIATQSSLENVLEALNGKTTLVAYMSVLLDNTIPQKESTFALQSTRTGRNWLDADSNRWLNPFNADTREWLAETVASVAALPFDAFLFDTLWFPPAGIQDSIRWGEGEKESRAEILQTLANGLIAAAGIPCWAVVQANVLSGVEPNAENAAQNVEFCALTFDRLFARLPDGEGVEPYNGGAAGIEIIPIITMPEGGAPLVSAIEDYNGYLAESAKAEYPAEVFAP